MSLSGRASCLELCSIDRLSDLRPRPAQAQPRCVSIWPTFMRLGTPSGLSTIDLSAILKERHVLDRHKMVKQLPCYHDGRPSCRRAGSCASPRRRPSPVFITPGGSSSPRCSFSTLSRKHCSSSFFDSSYCLRIASISAIDLSLGEADAAAASAGTWSGAGLRCRRPS